MVIIRNADGTCEVRQWLSGCVVARFSNVREARTWALVHDVPLVLETAGVRS